MTVRVVLVVGFWGSWGRGVMVWGSALRPSWLTRERLGERVELWVQVGQAFAEFFEPDVLHLAHPFAGHAEAVAEVRQQAGFASVEAEAALDDLAFPVAEGRHRRVELPRRASAGRRRLPGLPRPRRRSCPRWSHPRSSRGESSRDMQTEGSERRRAIFASGMPVSSASSSTVGLRSSFSKRAESARESSAFSAITRTGRRMVRERLLNARRMRCLDPEDRVGAELRAAVGVETLGGDHQPGVSLGDQIGEFHPEAVEVGGDADDEAEVRVDHPLARRAVPRLDPPGEFDFLLPGEEREFADLAQILLQRGVVGRRGFSSFFWGVWGW